MAVEPNVVINLGAEFVGKKAFKQADTALTKLTSGAKKLAGIAGIAYGTKAILAYGKASMKAAADDQKAQKILASNLKNVGLAYASVDAESFISSMEKQTAILDDQLRPAYSQLATTTGSVTKTQELMALAFDVSSGSGLDYSSTVDILTQAYVGNTKGLKQLNLGLTQAELKSMDFAQIQEKLKANFAGAGGASLDTYAGSMAKLSVATGNASETIGTALLDAIIKVSGSDGIDGLISKIDTLASGFASVVTQVGNATAALTGNETRKAFSPSFIVSGGRAGSKTVAATGAGNMALSVQSQDTQKSDKAAQQRAERAAAKRNADLQKQAKLANDLAKATKKNAADALRLAKAKTIFDLSKISIEAALKGKITDEERARLLLMKAIADENISMIDKYTKALNEAQLKTKELQAALDKVQGTTFGNPFQEAFYGGLTQAQIDLEKFKESGGFRLKWDATDYYRGLTQGEVDLEKFKEKGGFRLKWDATDYYKGLTQSQVDLEKFKERGMFRLKWDATDFYRGLTQAQKDLERFKEGGGFRRPNEPNPNEPTPPDSGGSNNGGNSGDLLPMFNMPSNFDMSGLNNSPGKNNGNNSVNNVVNISAGVVGSEDIIIMAVQNALNELSRRGNSITYAGAIA